MKKFLFLASMLATLFASCQKESFVEPTIEASGDFTASFADTRTELDGNAVVWCEEDLLTIFTKTAHNRKYQVKELSDDGRTATFGYVSFTGNNDTKITTNYALYPYDADATLTAGVVTTTLQPTQTYNGANGSLGYALMVARSSNTNYSFINAGSLLRFKLSKLVPDAFTLNTIKVASANNNIAGEVTINLGSSDAKAFVSSNGVKEITLSDINYDVTTDVKEFYVAMPSVSFEDKDLTVTFVFEEGEKVFKLPAFDLEQGKIKSIEYKINDAEDFTGGTPDSGEIVPVAKPAANEIWYTTTDGEMANLRSHINPQPISNIYDAEKGVWIMTFANDLERVPHSEGVFERERCSAIKTIQLPDGIKSISELSVTALSSLESINIPEGVTLIGNYAFSGCSSLKSLTIPSSVTTIETYNTFENCAGKLIVNCNLPNYTSSQNPFESNKFTEVYFGNGVTEIGDYTFSDSANLNYVHIPEGVTRIGNHAFVGCYRLTLTLPSTIKEIGNDALCYTVYCKATTPPTMGYNEGPTVVYVPASDDDSIINAYKSADGWNKDYRKFYEYEF